tara:strand:- start:65 stop:613 length:549 start_codon:yes stop_codon:yes gene_type:complete
MSNFSIGKHTYGATSTTVNRWEGNADLNIGKFCSIAGGVEFLLGGNHRTDWVSTFPFGHVSKEIFDEFNGVGHPSTKGDVNVGNDVWIGSNSTILSGITIGDGACIGTQSVVTKDVLPYTIVAGNPAKFIKKRFSDDIITKLLEVKWWELDDDIINHISPLLCSNNFEQLFHTINKIKNSWY